MPHHVVLHCGVTEVRNVLGHTMLCYLLHGSISDMLYG